MAFALCVIPALSANAYDVEDNGIYYTLNRKTGTASVTWLAHYDSSNAEAYKGDVVVPESISVDGVDYPVTAVASRAFYMCSELTSITLPSTITSIGQCAFQSCSGLSHVQLPSKLATIENATFQSCTSLSAIEFPSTLASISTSAFANCTSLEAIVLPAACGSIDNAAFGGCTSLKDVTLPRALYSTGYRVFSGCKSLETITINDNLPNINISLFENCENLKTVYLGKSITQIEPYAFSGCSNLHDIYFATVTPPGCGNASAFKNTPMVNLHVPAEGIEKFHTKTTWKDFENIFPLRCSTPVIDCTDGQLTFTTDTNLKYAKVSESFVYSIDVSDLCRETIIGDDADDAFCALDLTYDVRVKATIADGESDSEEIVAQLCWIDAENTFIADANELITAIDTPIQQRPVLVTSDGGTLSVAGLSDGERVVLYDLSGRQLGSQTVFGGHANFSAAAGQVVVVRVGASSFKVRVK